MQISRRDLFRSTVAIGGIAALGGASGLSAEAVAGTGPLARATATRKVTLGKGKPDALGYRKVVARPGEGTAVRTDLGAKPKPGRSKRRKGLLAFAQASDVHLCDSESPMRVEYAEHFSSSAYRPQEFLTLHVAEAMVQGLNSTKNGPITGKPISFLLQTGDNSDNAQYNEVRWNIDVLDGGPIQPDSGDHTKYEGVMDSSDPAFYDVQYWHPEGTPDGLVDDVPRSTYGFPVLPGLLAAARVPFEATGLDIPWYSVIGNHDKLVQGNEAPGPSNLNRAVGTKKEITAGKVRTVTADPDRRQVSTADIVAEHFNTPAAPGPIGHGYTDANAVAGTAYYTFDKGLVRFVVMDSVNANGGDEGSLSSTQFAWLQETLDAATGKLVVLSSHHPSWSMVNSVAGSHDPDPRVLEKAIVKELLSHKNVIAWVNGHTHSNSIKPHVRTTGKGKNKKVVNGFWEINTASHIDWPQQARLIEVADNKDGTLSIFTTMLDHAAPLSSTGLDDPLQLAALSRELAANDWDERDNNRRGNPTDRNTELLLKAPAFL